MSEDINEFVLDIQQRRKRSMAMRRNKQKLKRARERAQRKRAPEKNIKMRAEKLARQMVRKRVAGERGQNYGKLSPSEKIQVDKLLDTPEKIKLIKKLAQRLLPKVRRMEQDRLQSFMKGQQLKNLGQPEGHHTVNEELNEAHVYIFNNFTHTTTKVPAKVHKVSGDSAQVEYEHKGKTHKHWLPSTDKEHPTGKLSDSSYVRRTQMPSTTASSDREGLNLWAHIPKVNEDLDLQEATGLTLSQAIKHYKSAGWKHHSILKDWGQGRGTKKSGSYYLNSVSTRDNEGRPIVHHLKQDSRGTVRVRDGKTLKDTYHTSAHTLKVNLNEDLDLQELSKKTLGSYIKRASDDVEVNAYIQAYKDQAGDISTSDKLQNKLNRRRAGIHRAADRITMETNEELNQLFREYFGSTGVGGRQSMGGPAQNSNKMIGKDKKKVNQDPIKQYLPFNDKKEAKIKEALERKSEKSGVDVDVLAEVFVRGLEAYPENCRVTLEQYAFARVNSFINLGKTYYNEDADLAESCASKEKVKELEYEVDELEKAHKSPKAHKKALKEAGYLRQMAKGGKPFRGASKEPEQEHLVLLHMADGSKKLQKVSASERSDAIIKAKRELGSNAKYSFENRHIVVKNTPEAINALKARHQDDVKSRLLDKKEYDAIWSHLKESINEGKMKELSVDVKDMDNGNFKKKYGKSKDQMTFNLGKPTDKPVTEAKKMKGKDPCWKNYTMVGTKKKNGKEVPNCVPEAVEPEETEATKTRKQIQTVPRQDNDRKNSGVSTRQQEVMKKVIHEKLGNKTNDPKKRLTATDSLVSAYKADTPMAEEAGWIINPKNSTWMPSSKFESDNPNTYKKLGAKHARNGKGPFPMHSDWAQYHYDAGHKAGLEAEKKLKEEAESSDRKPVVVPSFTRRNPDGSTVTIPAKTILRKSNRHIVGDGNVHDGKPD